MFGRNKTKLMNYSRKRSREKLITTMAVVMDIISMGDFAISNKDGKTVFSFRVPSLERIDFTGKNIKLLNNKSLSLPSKIGRNDPCLCGSGKKYKNCCGKQISP